MIHKEAKLSIDGKYRYTLERRWNNRKGIVCFVMLNPSTADHQEDDHTIRKCMGFARRWGYGGIVVVNLFALRSTDPRELQLAHARGEDITGPHNHWHITAETQKADRVVIAWGCAQHTKKLQGLMGMSFANVSRLHGIHCLGRSKEGIVRHPLMLPYETPLEIVCRAWK